MFELVFHPGTHKQERIAFTVSEADLDAALDYGRAERNTPFQEQMLAAAYHKVLELNVCNDVERIAGEPWVIARSGRIIGRNVGAIDLSEDDLR